MEHTRRLQELRQLGDRDGLIAQRDLIRALEGMNLDGLSDRRDVEDTVAAIGDRDDVSFDDLVEYIYTGKIEWLRQCLAGSLDADRGSDNLRRIFNRYARDTASFDEFDALVRQGARLSEADCPDDDVEFMLDHMDSERAGGFSFEQFRDFLERPHD